MDRLGGPDGGEVAVALIGKDDVAGPHALDAGGHGQRPAVRRLDAIKVPVVIRHHRAADRRGDDGAVGRGGAVGDRGVDVNVEVHQLAEDMNGREARVAPLRRGAR